MFKFTNVKLDFRIKLIVKFSVESEVMEVLILKTQTCLKMLSSVCCEVI